MKKLYVNIIKNKGNPFTEEEKLKDLESLISELEDWEIKRDNGLNQEF